MCPNNLKSAYSQAPNFIMTCSTTVLSTKIKPHETLITGPKSKSLPLLLGKTWSLNIMLLIYLLLFNLNIFSFRLLMNSLSVSSPVYLSALKPALLFKCVCTLGAQPVGDFLAATKQLNEWYFLSVCLSVCHALKLFDYVSIIVSSWNFQELSLGTRVKSMQKVKVRGQRSRSQRSRPNLTVSGL